MTTESKTKLHRKYTRPLVYKGCAAAYFVTGNVVACDDIIMSTFTAHIVTGA